MLICDTREPQQEIWDVVANLDIQVPEFKFEKLDLADFYLDNGMDTLLIERKQLSDFCSSYVELRDRMNRMRERYDRTALLLEGNYSIRDGYIMLWRGNKLVPSMPHKAFLNFIASQQERGSYFYRTNDLTETIMQICYLYNGLSTLGKSPIRKTRSGMEIIASIPGMGPLSTFDVRSKYGSLGEALDKRDEWIPAKSKSMFESW